MKNKAHLAIIIPTFNRADTVNKTIYEFIRQINQNNLSEFVEIIVSDNASTDNTKEILKNIKEKYPNIFNFNINETNLGFGKNLERLEIISQSTKCDYIWTCGDDDIYHPDIVRTVYNLINSGDYDYIYLSYSDVNINTIPLHENITKIYSNKTELFKTIKNGPGFMSCNVFKKSFYVNIYTDNLVWRHFSKILNAPEEFNSCVYKENCIYVFRPASNNWFQPKTMFAYVSEIILEVMKANCKEEVKELLLKIYKKHFLQYYILWVIKEFPEDIQYRLKIAQEFEQASAIYNFNWKTELFFLKNKINYKKIKSISKFSKHITFFILFSKLRRKCREAVEYKIFTYIVNNRFLRKKFLE